MKKTWFELSIAVMIVVQKDDQILLGRRFNTGFKDGLYALPGGKHDGSETLRETVLREAKEELGIDVATDGVVFVGCVHYIPRPLHFSYIFSTAYGDL